jgi:hypothetical protein
MATEPNFNAVSPIALTADGTANGVLQVADTIGFYFGMQATLLNNASLQKTVYIKRVVNSTTLWVGASKGGIDHNVDVSAFTVATSSTIGADEQKKASVPMEARLLSTYETDPVDAWRTVPVDSYGNHYTNDNPFPVALEGSISISTVEVKGPNGNFIEPNADGSINVIVESVPSPNSTVISTYNAVSSVASGATTQIISYTVPPAMQAVLQRCPVSGTNVATYTLLINATTQDTLRTMFGADLTQEFNFTTGNDSGLILNAGDVVAIQVLHMRPYTGDFNARIQVLQIPA